MVQYPVQRKLKTLIQLILPKPLINAGSMGHMACKGFRQHRRWKKMKKLTGPKRIKGNSKNSKEKIISMELKTAEML